MQVNKPSGRSPYNKRREPLRPRPKRPSTASSEKKPSAQPQPATNQTPQQQPAQAEPYNKEDAIIDLYDESALEKNQDPEDVVINIDFTKPGELLGKIYQKIKEWLRVAQQNFNIDFIKSIKFSSKKERRRSYKILGGAAAVVLILWLVVGNLFSGGKESLSDVSSVQGVTGESVITEEAPEFELLYPGNRTKSDYSSIALVSPPGAPEAYAYLDKIDEVGVQVSQQEIPDNLKSNQDQELKSLAEGFSANDELSGSGFIGYVGLNRPGGPQSVVAIKDDRLIFIKTDSEVEQELLAKYLESLG